MKTLLIGDFADSKITKRINDLSSNNFKLAISSIKFSKHIADGLKSNLGSDSTNLFYIPMAIYPACKKVIWTKTKIDEDRYIPYINILFLKQITICLCTFCFCLKWFLKNWKYEKVFIFSHTYFPLLLSIIPFKISKKTKIVSFIPDLPEYAFSFQKNSFLRNLLSSLHIKISMKIVNVNDFLVFITKQMKDKFPNKPYIVIEGFSDYLEMNVIDEDLCQKKAIMYAGALYEKYGIKTLLESFVQLQGDYELWFFGNGYMEDEIKQFSKKDSRITFFGYKSNREIIEYEKRARILINPRPIKEEYTKYSFPSKLIEYMVSGNPVLTTKLPGIPEDYFDKMFFIEEETVCGFKHSLKKYLSKSKEELDAFGREAQQYVLEFKNNKVQIASLLRELKKY